MPALNTPDRLRDTGKPDYDAGRLWHHDRCRGCVFLA